MRTQVNYVAQAADLYADAGYTMHGSSYVITNQLSQAYLWDAVRVSLGAYGSYATFSQHSGLLSLSSYRDPGLLATLAAFADAPAWLRATALDDSELTKAIIGAIGALDGYDLPDAKGLRALQRHVLALTDAERQTQRDEILGTTVEHFRAYAWPLESVVGGAGQIAAVLSQAALDAASKEQPGLFGKVMRPV